MLTPPTADGHQSDQGGSLRAYGRHRSCSVEAVRRAIKSLRLRGSLIVDAKGKYKIRSFALADRELAANTDLSKAPGYVKERADAGRTVTVGVTEPRDSDSDTVTEAGTLTLTEASAEEKRWRARMARLDYEIKAEKFKDVDEIAAENRNLFVMCRTKLLGLPSKAKAAAPHLSHADVLLIDTLVREALTELSELADALADDTPHQEAS